MPADFDVAGASERLAAIAKVHPDVSAMQLVRLDDGHAVLLASAAAPDALARLDRDLAPWLAALALPEPPTTAIGQVVWTLDRADEWTHVDALDEVGRCEHFVRDAVETGMVWGLYDKTWARSMAAAGREALPLWPTRELAARCVAGPWRTFTPRAIELAPLLADWLTGMQEDGIVAVVTPTPADPGVVLEPEVLANALRCAQKEPRGA